MVFRFICTYLLHLGVGFVFVFGLLTLDRFAFHQFRWLDQLLAIRLWLAALLSAVVILVALGAA